MLNITKTVPDRTHLPSVFIKHMFSFCFGYALRYLYFMILCVKYKLQLGSLLLNNTLDIETFFYYTVIIVVDALQQQNRHFLSVIL